MAALERVGELERTNGALYCFRNVEVDSFVFNIAYLDKVEHNDL